jgi:hypothetical protein
LSGVTSLAQLGMPRSGESGGICLPSLFSTGKERGRQMG